MRIIGVTAAKVTPWMMGSLNPIFQKPTVWIRVATPHVKRSAFMRKTSSSSESPMASARMSGTATAPAYIASTCWNPRTTSLPSGKTSSTGWTRPELIPSLARPISLPPCRVRLISAEPLGLPLGLDLHLDGVRPGIERRLYGLHRGLQHLFTPAGEHRGLRPALARETRVTRRPVRRLDLLSRGPLGLGRREDLQLRGELGPLVCGH